MSDTFFMQRCLQLALLGEGRTAPNPLVGCVVVHNGRIIGEGYHQRYGESHAEVNAIGNVKQPELLGNSTLYVNLEPCNHHGKTPPCTDLIIRSGIPRVVVGAADSNPLVSGSGIQRLRQEGVEVISGVAEEACRSVNQPFYSWHERNRPMVILKWAETLDGFLDMERGAVITPCINWITDPKLKILVHRWRAAADAILVGATTVINDNPRLTAREWPGQNPLRIVFDPDGVLSDEYAVFDNSAPTWIYRNKPFVSRPGLVVKPVPPDRKTLPEQLLADLHDHQIGSLIVEGGAITLNSFISKDLWDEARVFTGNRRFLKGIQAPAMKQNMMSQHHYGSDILTIFRNNNPISL
jgi:diaminohydroxyphosphoribosylaminopyrimidine deaminase / 5-amino-6-(5-phosphoribosylamino)uracil reductase